MHLFKGRDMVGKKVKEKSIIQRVKKGLGRGVRKPIGEEAFDGGETDALWDGFVARLDSCTFSSTSLSLHMLVNSAAPVDGSDRGPVVIAFYPL